MRAIKKLFRTPAASSVELRQALTGLSTEDAERLVNELEAERRRALLDADDAELEALEAKLAKANLELERTRARISELHARITQAEAAERAAELTAERASVESQAQATAVALKAEYPRIVGELVTLLERLKAAEGAVENINVKLEHAGRGSERLAPVEARTVPMQTGMAQESQSIINRTSLRSFKSTRFAKGWNDPAASVFGD
jgi:chromosome segregation ATPase